ncbi:hypothetical protein AOLI_G00264800 [Acnodon oligacanthus]
MPAKMPSWSGCQRAVIPSESHARAPSSKHKESSVGLLDLWHYANMEFELFLFYHNCLFINKFPTHFEGYALTGCTMFVYFYVIYKKHVEI